jgi:hypothetical protein
LLDTLFPPGVPGYGTAPGVTVLSRLRPDSQPEGIRSGAFVVHPAWEQSLGYDSNVLGGPVPRGSWVLGSRPSLLIGSGWSHDALGAYVAADDRREPGAPAQDRTDWSASLGGGLDIGRDRLTLAAGYLSRHQDRTELDALPTDAPVPYRVTDARASYAWSAGRWTATPSVEIASWQFGTASILGAPASQSYRDRIVRQAGVTLGYELAPQRDLVLVTRAISQHYAHQPGLDSTGYQMLAGFDYDGNALWRYRLLLGGEQREFVGPTRAHGAAIAEAEIAWMPTGMTTIAATLSRSIEDAAQEGVAGFTLTRARLTLDHEYGRDILLHASAGLQRADILEGGAVQTGWTLGAGATWLLSKRVHVAATYDISGLQAARVSALPLTGSYTRNVALIMLRLGL